MMKYFVLLGVGVVVTAILISPVTSSKAASGHGELGIPNTTIEQGAAIQTLQTMFPGFEWSWDIMVPGAIRTIAPTRGGYLVVVSGTEDIGWATQIDPEGSRTWEVQRAPERRHWSTAWVEASDHGELTTLSYYCSGEWLSEVLDETGEVVWSKRTPKWPLIHYPSPDGQYFVPGRSDHLHMIDADGIEIPLAEGEAGPWSTYESRFLTPGLLLSYAGDEYPPPGRSEHELLLTSVSDRQLVWRASLSKEHGTWYAVFAHAPQGSRVIFWGEGLSRSHGSSVYCFDLAGNLVWENEGPEVQWQSDIALAEDGTRLVLLRSGAYYQTGEVSPAFSIIGLSDGTLMEEALLLPPGEASWFRGILPAAAFAEFGPQDLFLAGRRGKGILARFNDAWEHVETIRFAETVIPVGIPQRMGTAQPALQLIVRGHDPGHMSCWALREGD